MRSLSLLLLLAVAAVFAADEVALEMPDGALEFLTPPGAKLVDPAEERKAGPIRRNAPRRSSYIRFGKRTPNDELLSLDQLFLPY